MHLLIPNLWFTTPYRFSLPFVEGSRTYFYNKRTQNIYKLIGSKGNVIYLQCDVDNCGNHAKWRKNANIVEEYEADHNHNCSVSYNKFKVHCMMFRIKEIVDDTENVRKTASEVFNMAVDEFSSSPISLPNGFKKKMIKKIYNARNRRCVHRTVSSSNKTNLTFLEFTGFFFSEQYWKCIVN